MRLLKKRCLYVEDGNIDLAWGGGYGNGHGHGGSTPTPSALSRGAANGLKVRYYGDSFLGEKTL